MTSGSADGAGKSGLPNKEALEQCLRKICKKDVTPAAYVAMDMDGMKALNDKYSHTVADLVIEGISNILRKFAKDEGVQAFKQHTAGDEFGIVIQGMKSNLVQAYIEDVRQMVEQASKTTASFGIAMRCSGEPFSRWDKRTEKALNDAKKRGKNCCVLAK